MQVDQSVKNAYYLSGRRTLVRLSCSPPVPPRERGWHERTAVQSDDPATRREGKRGRAPKAPQPVPMWRQHQVSMIIMVQR